MSVTLPLDNETLTTNSIRILEKESDANFRKTPFVDMLNKAQGSRADLDGGPLIIKDVEFGQHSQVTEMTGRGYDVINTAVALTGIPAEYTWWRAVMPIVISQRERDENDGDTKVLDLAGKRTRNVQGWFTRFLEQQLLQGNVSGFSALTHLNGIDYSTGVLEAAVYASQTRTVGGISKATYAGYPGWVNQWGNVAGSASSNGVAQLDYVTTAARNRSPDGIGLWIFSESFANHMLRQARTYKRWVKESAIDFGAITSEWNGRPMTSSTYMPNAGSVTGTAGSEVSGYGLDVNNMTLWWRKGRKFYLRPFEDIPGTETSIALLICMAQLGPEHLGGSAVLTGGDTY